MDSIANLPTDDRRKYFEEAAARDGRLSAQLMEKDFWVCWILNQLFSLKDINENFTFKGGTSLSKVFQVIERFSEDIDLSIERSFLGFGGENEPEKGASGKEKERRLVGLKSACQKFVANQLYSELDASLSKTLTTKDDWKLILDADDPDHQSIRYQFPQAITADLSSYIAQSVKIEFGARSDHFPVSEATIKPYLDSAIPNIMSDCTVRLRVLDGERTFWEKATILHANHHRSPNRSIGSRQSRHYYDLFQLANHEIGDRALKKQDLLERVAFHKSIYFKAAWPHYERAKPGSLRLIPGDEHTRELKRDYENMQPMFFGEIPEFSTILERLKKLENRINTADSDRLK